MGKRRTTEEFIQRAKTVHGDKYGYEKVVYVHAHSKVIITCQEHGDFNQAPNKHSYGRGCPGCKAKRLSENFRKSTDEIIQNAKEMHGSRYNYDKVEYVDAKTKIIIGCSEHGDFLQLARPHIRGSGCPTCGKIVRADSLRMDQSEFIQKAKEVHGDTYGYDKVEYFQAHAKVIITCSEHGDFEQPPTSHLSGRGCKACAELYTAKLLRMDKGEFIQKAKKVHGDTYAYDKVEYVDTHTAVIITCPEHGDFEQARSRHLSGAGCQKCAGNEQSTTEEFIQKARAIHGDTYAYDKVEYVGTNTAVIITCPEHGNFLQTPHSHIGSRGMGCLPCAIIKRADSLKITAEEFIQKARAIHGDTYAYDKVEYVNMNTDVIITCSEHGDFEQRPGNHLFLKGCSRCKNKAEGKLAIYLNERYITHRQHRIEGKFFDFYLPEYNLLIERDGEQHYRLVEFWAAGNDEYIENQQANDQYKTDLAKQHGYKIARIPYWLTDEEAELELDNILKGQPTYPDVPDLEQAKTQPKPRVDRDA